jgi:hypothetical protein
MTARTSLATALAGLVGLSAGPAIAQTVYLNKDNITVAVGPGTSAGSFNNTFANGATIGKVIDAPNAAAPEFHNQETHIWFTANAIGGGLQLLFDFQASYDIATLHFWNYDGEAFDVDNVDFTFFDAANVQVGALSVQPALGSSPAIFAQDIALAAPLNVRYVAAFLTGSNGQVDFQNIGFTAGVSVVPEPLSVAMLPLGLAGLLLAARRGRNKGRSMR